jgi:hypothetical protein
MHDPRILLTPDRLDFAIKHRFFRHLSEGNDPDSERIYRWHIETRTGGRELRSWKVSLDDYVKGCVDLLASMKAKGFDRSYPVRLGMNRILMEGAHRTSCALYLGLPIGIVYADRDGRASPWGREYLLEHGIAPEDLARIEADFQAL